MDGVADGDNVARTAHIQVGTCKGDEARVCHSVLVPAQNNRQFTKLSFHP